MCEVAQAFQLTASQTDWLILHPLGISETGRGLKVVCEREDLEIMPM